MRQRGERLRSLFVARAMLDGAGVGLMAAAGKEGFRERYGFTRRPNERLGAGRAIASYHLGAHFLG